MENCYRLCGDTEVTDVVFVYYHLHWLTQIICLNTKHNIKTRHTYQNHSYCVPDTKGNHITIEMACKEEY